MYLKRNVSRKKEIAQCQMKGCINMNVPRFDVSVVDDDVVVVVAVAADDVVVVVDDVAVVVVVVVGSSLVAPNRSTITERSDGILVFFFGPTTWRRCEGGHPCVQK